jgi:hypothetical protein
MKYLTAEKQAQVLTELEPFLNQVAAGIGPNGVKSLYQAMNRRDDFFSSEVQFEINTSKGDLGLVDYLSKHPVINQKLGSYKCGGQI